MHFIANKCQLFLIPMFPVVSDVLQASGECLSNV